MTKKEKILILRAQGLSYSQIAKRVGVTASYVSAVCNPSLYERRVKANVLKRSKESLIRKLHLILERDPSFAREVRAALRGGESNATK